MKKFINALAIVLFLAPVFSYAMTKNYTCDDFPITNAGFSCSDGVVTFFGTGYGYSDDLQWTGGTTVYVNFVTSGIGDGTAYISGETYDSDPILDYTGGDTFSDEVTVVGDNVDRNALVLNSTGFVGTISNICVTDTPGDCVAPPPPPPGTGIDAAVNVATTSFKKTYGFDMDALSAWMWDNLGQPILGSGIGVLYVMRYYWLGLIAMGIIIFFCFGYFRFFKR